MGQPSMHGLDFAYGTNLQFRGHDGATVFYTPARELLVWDGRINNWMTASGKALHSASSPRILTDDFKAAVLDPRHKLAKGDDNVAAYPALVSGSHLGELLFTTGDADTGISHDGSAWSGPSLDYAPEDGTITFEAKIKLSRLSYITAFIGLTDTLVTTTLELPFSLSGTSLTSNATDAVGFLWDPAATNDYWQCVGVADDTDADILNSAVAPVADTYVTLKVVVATDGSARFFVNGTLIGTLAGACSPDVDLVPVIVACASSSYEGTTTSPPTSTTSTTAAPTVGGTLTADYVSCR